MYRDCGGAALAHILDLPMKRLIISDGYISKGAADIFVEALKNREHSFTDVDLFSWTWIGFPNFRPLEPWKKSLQIELRKLTWRNHFQEDKVTFLDRVLRQQGMPKKGYYLPWKGEVVMIMITNGIRLPLKRSCYLPWIGQVNTTMKMNSLMHLTCCFLFSENLHCQ
jgi:hypothetical protein